MVEKNKKKLEAKKRRNLWNCSRPVTQVVPNKKAYSRKRIKDRFYKEKES